MLTTLALPGIPDNDIDTVIISPQFPEIASALNKLGIKTLFTEECSAIQYPVRFHPDMLVCHLGNNQIILDKSQKKLYAELNKYYFVRYSENILKINYPDDIALNVIVTDTSIIGLKKNIDKSVLDYAKMYNLKTINCNQGYTGCSTAMAGNRAIITEDENVAAVFQQIGYDVLKILHCSSSIRLPGYDSGFIGGCCGMISPKTAVFTGRLDKLPDGVKIKEFFNCRGIRIIELTDSFPVDIGGIIPILQRTN